MATNLAALLTPRDRRLLEALDWTPLTARQLLKLSAVWDDKFGSLRMVRERAQVLTALKLVRTFRYATLSPGQPENYYVLSRAGFQLLYGPDAMLPARGQFDEVAISRHLHTRALADFLIQLQIAAHRSDVEITTFHRENSLRLECDGEALYPDAALVFSRGDTYYRFFVEIDCATERLRSEVSVRTWQRKARIYTGLYDRFGHERFRVLVVAAQGAMVRLTHILQTAAAAQRVPERTVFYGIGLPACLTSLENLHAPVFVDHRGQVQSLMPDAMPNYKFPVDNSAQLQVSETA